MTGEVLVDLAPLSISPLTLVCALADSCLRNSPSTRGGAMRTISFISPDSAALLMVVAMRSAKCSFSSFVPVGGLDRVAGAVPRGEGAARRAGSLVVRCRIILHSRFDHAKIEKVGVAVIFEKKRPAAISDKHPGTIMNSDICHCHQ